jgi:hypothetical protein
VNTAHLSGTAFTPASEPLYLIDGVFFPGPFKQVFPDLIADALNTSKFIHDHQKNDDQDDFKHVGRHTTLLWDLADLWFNYSDS